MKIILTQTQLIKLVENLKSILTDETPKPKDYILIKKEKKWN
jgi:adenosine/AMP kinase